VSKTLTLNLGLRNEFLGAHTTRSAHRQSDPNLANTTGQPYVYPSASIIWSHWISGTLNQAGLDNEIRTVWEPRIGFAYDVGAITSHRFGAATALQRREDLGAVDNLAIVPPTYPFLVGFDQEKIAWRICLPTALRSYGIPPLGANPTQTYVLLRQFCRDLRLCVSQSTSVFLRFQRQRERFDPTRRALHWVAGTTQQWNFTIQHELGRDWFMELVMSAPRARACVPLSIRTRLRWPRHRLRSPFWTRMRNLKAQLLSCTIVDSTVENASARAPYLGIAPGDFEDFAPNSDSHYSALQATLATASARACISKAPIPGPSQSMTSLPHRGLSYPGE